MKVKTIKGVSRGYSKINNFGDYKKCLDGEDYQNECDNYNIRSLIHELYLQRVKKSTLTQYDDKRCSESKIETKPRE